MNGVDWLDLADRQPEGRRSYFDLDGWFGTEAYAGVEFELQTISMKGGLWPAGSLFVMAEATLGDQIDYANVRPGTVVRLEPSVQYRLGRHLNLNLEHVYERLSVDGERLYAANVTQLRGIYQFTKRMFLRAVLQYMDVDSNPELYLEEIPAEERTLFSQLLFSYKINARTVLYLGYSDNHYGDEDFSMLQTDRTAFIKLGYAWVL